MEKRVDARGFDDNEVLPARNRRLVSETKDQDFDRDRYELARVGKEQVLKVSGDPTHTPDMHSLPPI